MAQFEIYCYTCHCVRCDQRDMYTGKAQHGAASRHKGHVAVARAILANKGTKKHIKFDYFMAKHGIENLQYRVVQTCSSENEMNQQEIHWIAELKTSFEFGGLNFDIGGKGGRKKGVWSPSLEQREKLRIANTGRTVSEEEQIRNSQSMLNYWNSLTEEERTAHAEKGWTTIHSKAQSDSIYAENIKKLMQEKSAKGVETLALLMEDDEYRHLHNAKVSEGVSKWCNENPSLVMSRAAKIVAARNENGTWAIAQKRARENTTKAEFQRRAAKSWETRRKGKQND